MKYLLALILGIAVGVLAFAAALYFNPFIGKQSVSPLALSSEPQLNLSYSAVPADALVFTNNGESTLRPHPEKMAELWEPTIRNTRIAIVEIRNSRGDAVGAGIKFSSNSEATRLLNSQALVDSAWHIYLPGRGTLFVGQREDYWSFLRDVVLQAELNSADNWRGTWNRVMTAGPNALGTGIVSGGSGRFAAIDSEAVESLSANAYSARIGPVAMSGSLAIVLNDNTSTAQAVLE